jgi:hypothetical protein
MYSFDLYGWESEDLEYIRLKVESALDIKFELHDSAYHGGDYYLYGKLNEENYSLERNLDLDEDELTESDYPECKVLLYVNRTKSSKYLRNKIEAEIEGSKFLRHEEV